MNEAAMELLAKETRRFKPYPTYKDSGVEWLGKIPAHWNIKPLKYLTAFTTGWTPPTGREDLYGGDHLWANIGDLGPKVLYTTEKSISDIAIREARMRMVPAGSLLFSFKLSVGTVSIAGVDMYTNEAIAAFEPSSRIDTSYLYWSAPIFVPHNAQDNIYGAPLLNRDRIANAILLSPALPEQRAIAAFLDRETAKIDALVAKKERVIDLLQEKRTALITRAVTKGLDPSVRMKDSGVEWLGRIPAHWTAVPLKRVLLEHVTNGLFKKREAWGSGALIINVVDLYRSDFRVDTASLERVDAQSEEIAAFAARAGDIFFVRSSLKREGIGSSACLTEAPEQMVFECHLVRARPNPRRVSGRYLAAYLNASVVRQRLVAISETTTMTTIAQPNLETLEVILPPRPEQEAALAWLDVGTGSIDALITKIRSAIDRLTELRTALISAAVTGKIDVRKEVA